MSEEQEGSNSTENTIVEPQNNEVEDKARRLGWVPQEEFKGDPEQWRDADAFIKRGEEIQGYLRKDLDRLHSTLSQRDREIAEIRQTMEEFRNFHNETEARAYKRAIDELKQLKVVAIEEGNGSKVVEIDEQLDQLKEAQAKHKQTAPKPQAEINKDYAEWLPNNKWYLEDPELAEIADSFGDIVKKNNPNLVGKEFLDEVTKKVKKVAPEKFENPNRNQSSVGSSSGNRSPSGSKKKAYSDLPADAKAACDRFVKQKLMTVDQYLKEYEWE